MKNFIIIMSCIFVLNTAYAEQKDYFATIKMPNKIQFKTPDVAKDVRTKVCRITFSDAKYPNTWGVAIGHLNINTPDGIFDFGKYTAGISSLTKSYFVNGYLTSYSTYNSKCYEVGQLVAPINSCTNRYWLWANGIQYLNVEHVNVYIYEGAIIDSISLIEKFDGSRGISSYNLKAYDCSNNIIHNQNYNFDNTKSGWTLRDPIDFKSFTTIN